MSLCSRLSARTQPGLSISLQGGYSGNLYADSFAIGNTYLLNTITASVYHPRKVALYYGYSLSYLEYDIDDIINNFLHSFRASVYDKRASSKFKWGLTVDAFLKDYTDLSSTFNNQRLSLKGELSYYVNAALQLKTVYGFSYSNYSYYDILENHEHQAQLELIKTLSTKTTLRGELSYGARNFPSGNSSFDWLGAGLKVTQSFGIRTGMSVSYLQRFASDETRPLSSFYIISGVTQYWDPWDGSQAGISIKRILPLAIVSYLEFDLWKRRFSYDPVMQTELPWIDGKTGREDHGWSFRLKTQRQFNTDRSALRVIRITGNIRYLSNGSDDDYYDYDDISMDASLSFDII